MVICYWDQDDVAENDSVQYTTPELNQDHQ